MEPTTILLTIVGVLIVLFLMDLFFAGGTMTMGTMHGMAMMGSNPIGQAILLVLLVILGVLVYGVFFR
ncbi:MAG: hypothetical protein V1755_15985 [Chloroflexota bacterium]